jgi:hypothetical protein
MTEAEWLTCPYPYHLLPFLRGKASDRKLRLFACACCRRIWHLLPDQRARDAVETAERFADGLVDNGERVTARKAAQQVAQSRAVTTRPRSPKWQRRAASAVYHATARGALAAAWDTSHLAVDALVWGAGGYGLDQAPRIGAAEQAHQADVLRDVFGNPFRPTAINQLWRDWQGGTSRKLAQAIYDGRRFEDMPVLADALEDAGCTDAAILEHCRKEDHVRGCWVLDGLLDRG